MSRSIIAVYDACVLYPAPLRDLLMQLAATNIFRAKWTDEIHDEWIRNVLKSRPDLSREQLDRTRQLMDQNTLDCLVEDYQSIIPKLSLPDAADRHVLAASIYSNASIIVTFNLKDFPPYALDQYGIESMHPDDFVFMVSKISLEVVLQSINLIRSRLKNPPRSAIEYLSILENQGLLKTVKLLSEYKEII